MSAGCPTAVELDVIERKVAELRERGYVDLHEHVYDSGRRLCVGARVRHRGEQWPDAYRLGTGNVVALMHRPDSPWSRSWHMPDIEMVVLRDKPRIGNSRIASLAHYHVEVIEVSDVAR